MDEHIIKTIRYFGFFSYPPSFEEIYTFLPLKTTRKDLDFELKRLVEKGFLIKDIVPLPQIVNLKFLMLNLPIYTLLPYRIFLEKRVLRAETSQKKVKKMTTLINSLRFFSQIKLVGLSGGLSMMNATGGDDVDIFIITAKNRLFTGRLLVTATAEILGVRRRRKAKEVRDKACLNLFFDEDVLTVSQAKRNLYVAHEILQMKPLIERDRVYERFLAANDWIMSFFPNAFKTIPQLKATQKIDHNISIPYLNYKKYLGDFYEFLLKKLQLTIMEKHKTTELIGDDQLWFFPDDFERKLKRKGLI